MAGEETNQKMDDHDDHNDVLETPPGPSVHDHSGSASPRVHSLRGKRRYIGGMTHTGNVELMADASVSQAGVKSCVRTT